ncbi:MAG: peptidyl-tRNA hydrolase, partial [Chromatiales bacterium RIFOXYA1_FULL_46_5]
MVTLVLVKPGLELDLDELEFSFIRAQGSGGQHVNKVSTAVQLRFDIERSSLPDDFKQKLLQYPDDRVSKSGVIVIKAQAHRSQDMNKEDAVAKLMQLLQSASFEA